MREYAKLQQISPPTASKRLEELYEENLLKKEIDKQYFYYFAGSDDTFRDLQRIYWRLQFRALIQHIEENCIDPVLVLFGSLAKAEAKKDSDIDLALFTPSEKPELKPFEKKLNREIQLFSFQNLEEIPKEFRKSILNGYILSGSW
ncbi:MAG: nucleotidyltransferase family protein [Nanobdellota archaeon]